MAEQATVEKEIENSEDEAISRIYELGYHFVASISEEDILAKEAELKEKIQKLGGEVIASEEPKRVSLAYTIKKKVGSKYERHTEGFFGWMKFAVDADKAQTLHHELLGAEDILRHLLFKTVKEDTRAGIRGAGMTVIPTKGTGKRLVTEDTGGPVSEEDIENTVNALVAETESAGDDEKKEAE